MNVPTLLAGLLALSVTASGGPLALQDPAPQEPPVESPTDKPVQRLEAWPELEADKRAKRELAKLRKANTDGMASSAAEWLTEAGAGAAPLLIDALGKERDAAALERLRAVLVSVTGPAHTRLLALEFDHKSPEVRRFTLLRVARFPDPGVADAARAALSSARQARKPAEDEIWAAALCCAAGGATEGLDTILAGVQRDWGTVAADVRRALEGVRGPAASAIVEAAMQGAERKRTLAGLRMLAGCGDESAIPTVRFSLNSSDNTERVAAINACRGIVDGDPPLERLSAFDAIELAKAWAKKL